MAAGDAAEGFGHATEPRELPDGAPVPAAAGGGPRKVAVKVVRIPPSDGIGAAKAEDMVDSADDMQKRLLRARAAVPSTPADAAVPPLRSAGRQVHAQGKAATFAVVRRPTTVARLGGNETSLDTTLSPRGKAVQMAAAEPLEHDDGAPGYRVLGDPLAFRTKLALAQTEDLKAKAKRMESTPNMVQVGKNSKGNAPAAGKKKLPRPGTVANLARPASPQVSMSSESLLTPEQKEERRRNMEKRINSASRSQTKGGPKGHISVDTTKKNSVQVLPSPSTPTRITVELEVSRLSVRFDPLVLDHGQVAEPRFANVVVTNTGRVAFNFQWVEVRQGNPLQLNAVAQQRSAFSVLPESGCLLPGQSRGCAFSFCPRAPGLCAARFALLTDKPSAPGQANQVVQLHGLVLITDDRVSGVQDRRKELRERIKLQQERHAAEDALAKATAAAHAEITRRLAAIRDGETQLARNKLEEAWFNDVNKNFALPESTPALAEFVKEAVGEEGGTGVLADVDGVHAFPAEEPEKPEEEPEPEPEPEPKPKKPEPKRGAKGKAKASAPAPVSRVSSRSSLASAMSRKSIEPEPPKRRTVFYRTAAAVKLRALAVRIGYCDAPEDWNCSLVALANFVDALKEKGEHAEAETEFRTLLEECLREPTEAELDDKGDGIVVQFTPVTKVLRALLQPALESVVGAPGAPAMGDGDTGAGEAGDAGGAKDGSPDADNAFEAALLESQTWLVSAEEALAREDKFALLGGAEGRSAASDKSAAERAATLGAKRLTRKQREAQRQVLEAEFAQRLAALKEQSHQRFVDNVRTALGTALGAFDEKAKADKAVTAYQSSLAGAAEPTTPRGKTPNKAGPKRGARGKR